MFRLLLVLSLLLIWQGEAWASLGAERQSSTDVWAEDGFVVQISASARVARAEIIRDTAASAGLTNAVLIAGLAQVETKLAHCWSEATWACKGPDSSSCGGGPVIAGSADGSCSLQRGGLGLFQFDAGTYSQTVAEYGADIVTIEGNTRAIVPYLTERAIQSVDGVNSTQEALDWMNSIPIVDGNSEFESWLYFIAWRYNGCKACPVQQNKYRAGTHLLYEEMGASFWSSSNPDPDPDPDPDPGPDPDPDPDPDPSGCATITEEGRTIEEDDECFVAHGPAQYWRTENEGHGGVLMWTKTTSSESASNYGVWRLRFKSEMRHEVSVHTDGGDFGQSRQAAYEIQHAGGTDTVVIDQRSQSGWISLGTYDFDAGTYEVRLNDNTGEEWPEGSEGIRLIFDALRVAPEDNGSDGLLGGCTVSSSQALGDLWPLLLALLLLRRRRRRHRAA